MTLSQTIGFYLAMAGIGFSLSIILVCIMSLLHSAKRWLE